MGNQRTTQIKTTEANHQRKASMATQPPLSIYSPVHPILQLQQQLGNQAVNRLIQTKMTVGKPGDIYEKEADQVAATVMRTPAPQVQRQTEEEEVQAKPITPLVQRQSEEEDEKVQMLQRQSEDEDEKVQMLQRQSEEEDEKVQMLQRQAEDEDEKVQAKAVPGQTPAVSPHLESKIQSRRGTGQPLPKSTRAFMEPRFGADFSGVRIHTDSSAVQMNKELGAKAFTNGNDVYFNSGKFNPGSSSGKELLAHELTHTIQQTGGVQAKLINKKAKKENKIQAKTIFPIQRKEATVQQEVKKASPDSVDNLEKNQQVGNSETPVAKEEKNQTSPQNQDSVAPEVNATVTAENSTSPQEKGGEVPPKTADAKAEISLNQETKSPESGNQESTATVSEITTQETAPVTPDSDPDFLAVVSKAKGVANKEKQHAPADTKAKQAQDAAESPASEVESKAQGNQVGEMAQTPTPAFNAAAFKAKLMERVKEAAPKNLEQADNFKNNNQLGAVKSQMQAQVKQEQTASQAPLEEKTKQAPDTSGIEPKSVTPLPPNEAGAATKNIRAEKAVPKAKGQGEVEAPLQESSQKLEQQMAEGNVTEEQLAKSNEPQFQSALGAKQEASKKAQQAPQEYRQFEQNQLTQAEGEATATAEQKLQGMNGSRAQLLSQVTNQQVGAKGKDEQARAKVAGDIKNMYQATKTSVENILKGIEGGVMSRFNAGTARAREAYENYVAPYMENYKSRYDGIWGAGRWLKDKFLGVPPEVTAFFDKGRKKYLNEMDITLTDIANYVTDQLNQAKEKIAEGRKEIQEYVDGLPASLQKVGQDAANNIEGEFDRLEQSVDDKNNQLIDTLSQGYTKNLEEMDARIKEMKASNQPWFAKAFDGLAGVIETINKLKNMLMNVLAKVADTVSNIIKDPIGFLGNLVKGIKQGFENFVGNIGQHLQAGLIGWLTGTLGPMGIELPEDIFSLPGIFSLVTQVLGLTFSYIRGKAVKLFGEPVVAGMEKGVEIFQVLRDRGVMGLWEYVKEQFNDLKETVIGEIKNMVITQVITAGVKWILSLLNPASAFVKAAMAIYDIIMFFVNRGSQVLELVNAVVDAVAAIASGAVGGAAKLVENALARALPVAIGFLASIAGISGLAKKVEGIIGKIRQRVDKGIDKVLLKAKKLLRKKNRKANKEKSNQEKDERSPEEKEHDLKAAQKALKEIISKSISIAQVEKVFPAIKDKFRLKKLEWEKLGTPSAVIVMEINPKATIDLNQQGHLKLNEGDTTHSNQLGLSQKITFEGGTIEDLPVGRKMTATKLGPNHPQGGPPQKSALEKIMEPLPTNRNNSSDKKYVKGHLLNDNLGGLGEDRNLYPITADANQKHEQQVESVVKSWVNDEGYWVYYTVEVDQKSENLSKSEVTADLICEANKLDANGKRTSKDALKKIIRSQLHKKLDVDKKTADFDDTAKDAQVDPGFDKDKVELSTSKKDSSLPQELKDDIKIIILENDKIMKKMLSVNNVDKDIKDKVIKNIEKRPFRLNRLNIDSNYEGYNRSKFRLSIWNRAINDLNNKANEILKFFLECNNQLTNYITEIEKIRGSDYWQNNKNYTKEDILEIAKNHEQTGIGIRLAQQRLKNEPEAG